MPRGGARPNSGRKFKNSRQNTVYIGVTKETKEQIKALAKKHKMTVIDFISYFLKNSVKTVYEKK